VARIEPRGGASRPVPVSRYPAAADRDDRAALAIYGCRFR
jgi:hypothetical protein